MNLIRFRALLLVALVPTLVSRADDPPPGDSQRRGPSVVNEQQRGQDEPVDFDRARQLFRKRQAGERLSADEEAYLQRAIEARRRIERRKDAQADGSRALPSSDKTGLKPLDEMSAEDRYLEQDGGLYGHGVNQPPDVHRQAAQRQLARIQPLNATGEPASDGRIVLVSISMSNATQESTLAATQLRFQTFKHRTVVQHPASKRWREGGGGRVAAVTTTEGRRQTSSRPGRAGIRCRTSSQHRAKHPATERWQSVVRHSATDVVRHPATEGQRRQVRRQAWSPWSDADTDTASPHRQTSSQRLGGR